ncbi:hypothetical protein EV359DRAFT_72011 [Lentinula novae-zelandiae]|nr:hypothetical protein EV359DRAFT_72011 [Lentinula novae-zelandiae]
MSTHFTEVPASTLVTITFAFAQTGVSRLALLALDKSGLEISQKACRKVQHQEQDVKIQIIGTDVADTKGVAPASKTVETTLRRFHIVVKNASSLRPLPLLISSFDGLKTIINLTGFAAHFVGTGFSVYQQPSVLRDSKDILSFGVHPGAIATDMVSHLPGGLVGVLVDTLELSHSIVFYSKDRRDWLDARYISAQWDVDELKSKRDEVIASDKSKVRW